MRRSKSPLWNFPHPRDIQQTLLFHSEATEVREFLGYIFVLLAITVMAMGFWAMRYYSPARECARLRA